MISRFTGDLEYVVSNSQGIFSDLKNARIFITGGTGFFGTWLLESLLYASEQLALGVRVVVLTRNPAAFADKAPRLANHPIVRLHTGDVRTFEFPEGAFSHVIHAATSTHLKDHEESPLGLLETVIDGTRRTL